MKKKSKPDENEEQRLDILVNRKRPVSLKTTKNYAMYDDLDREAKRKEGKIQ